MNTKIEPSLVPIEHNIALDLVRITEVAAMAAARYLGRGDKTLKTAGINKKDFKVK